jgi:hypothetical protein
MVLTRLLAIVSPSSDGEVFFEWWCSCSGRGPTLQKEANVKCSELLDVWNLIVVPRTPRHRMAQSTRLMNNHPKSPRWKIPAFIEDL